MPISFANVLILAYDAATGALLNKIQIQQRSWDIGVWLLDRD